MRAGLRRTKQLQFLGALRLANKGSAMWRIAGRSGHGCGSRSERCAPVESENRILDAVCIVSGATSAVVMEAIGEAEPSTDPSEFRNRESWRGGLADFMHSHISGGIESYSGDHGHMASSAWCSFEVMW